MTEREKALIAEWREIARLRELAYSRTLAEVVSRLGRINQERQMMNFGAVGIGIEALQEALSGEFGPPMLFEDKLKEVSK